MRRLSVRVVLLAALLPLTSQAADFDTDKLGQLRAAMQKFVDNGQLAGVVTVVGDAKGIASCEAVGLRELGGEAMPKDALFRIASMTKPITAVGIMILQDEGKLSVEDSVEKYLPEFGDQMMIEKRDGDRLILKKPSRPVKIRDLLTHTSGLPNYPPGLGDVYARRHRTLAESILTVSQRPLEFEPGSRWAYCNPGIDALGRIIEVVAGKSYERFMADRIFTPLGMKDTTFRPTAEQQKRLAGLYGTKEGKLIANPAALLGVPSDKIRHPVPAGGLYSTGADLARFYQMMIGNGAMDGKRVLSEQAVKTMTALQTGDLKTGFTDGMGFGFGFAVVRKPEGVTTRLSAGSYGHGGAFGTQGWIDPKRGVFVVLLIQRTGLPNADASDMRKVLQDIAFDAFRE